ncbi:hypothetical protein ACFFRR_006490 [Megaselia abdita]
MRNVSAHFHTYKFYNQFRPLLVNEWINLCQAVDNVLTYNFFIRTLLRVASKFSNFVKCFHKADEHYYARNVDISSTLVNLLEYGKYKICLDVYEGSQKEPVGNYSLSFEIYEKFKKPKFVKS